MTPLTHAEISIALEGLHGWKLEQGAIAQTFTFPDFLAAMSFVDQVALAAEAANHHPDIDIRWNRVRLSLRTHDSDGITQKDIELARKILSLFSL